MFGRWGDLREFHICLDYLLPGDSLDRAKLSRVGGLRYRSSGLPGAGNLRSLWYLRAGSARSHRWCWNSTRLFRGDVWVRDSLHYPCRTWAGNLRSNRSSLSWSFDHHSITGLLRRFPGDASSGKSDAGNTRGGVGSNVDANTIIDWLSTERIKRRSGNV